MAIIAEAGGLHRTRAGHDEHATLSRVLDKDEELGRRDGDYSKRARASRWLPVKARRSRLLLTLAVLGAMWLLFQILPGGEEIRERTTRRWTGQSDGTEKLLDEDATTPSLTAAATAEPSENPIGAPPLNKGDPTNPYMKHYYNDVIKFYNLAGTLHKITRTGGFKEFNRNVLFAASSLKSVSALIPLACEMRKWDRNTVHFAIFGRDDLTMAELHEINGVDGDTCDIYWHDARPDYAPYSTELRAETGATFAFKSINDFMHPQVIITNELEEEDHFFKVAVHRTATAQRHPIIQIPKDAADTLSWIARLDVEPLRDWHEMSVEILVHAPPNSVGSLRRLMSSLTTADYTGLAFPRLTFEIPVDVDPMLKHFLEQVRWPPEQEPQLEHKNLLTIRHRISNRKITPEEASVRFVESFYPTASYKDHVLVVSPNAQLSPQYYQYVMYNALQYRSSDRLSEGTEHLMGISLEVPTTLLDGSTPLNTPDASFYDRPYDLNGHHNGSTPFLWEAPNSGAALYFGDKWTEIHSFITNRIMPQKNSTPKEKAVSAALPSWLEYFHELTRLRGYTMLYPSLEGETALVTVHHEATHRPEEFDHRVSPDAAAASAASEPSAAGKSTRMKRDLSDPSAVDDNDPFVLPVELPAPIPEQKEVTLLVSDIPLTKMLPNDGDLLSLDRLPLLSYAGAIQSRGDLYDVADNFAQRFRRERGGCDGDALFESKRKRKYFPGFANDLFCTGDETTDDYLPLEEVEELPRDTFDFPPQGEAIGARVHPITDDAGAAPLAADTLAGGAPVPIPDAAAGAAIPAADAPGTGAISPAAAPVAPLDALPPLQAPVAPAADAPAPIAGVAPLGGDLNPAAPPANLPLPGDFPPAPAPAADLPVIPPLGDNPFAPPVQAAQDPVAAPPPPPVEGDYADPAVMQQLADAGVPPAAPAMPYNLPKRPTIPHEQHEMNKPLKVREKDGNVVAVPYDLH